MKHLFIINPEAAGIKGKARSISQRITLFFHQYPDISYHIHITRWCRDALAFSFNYANSNYLTEPDGLIRIHIIGGMGTVNEVINGIIGLPGVQIAIYPYGNAGKFLKCFGEGQQNMFSSFYHQVFSETTAIDVLKCGNHFALAYSYSGLPYRLFSLLWRGWKEKKLHQRYQVNIDGRLLDDECLAVYVFNAPTYNEKIVSVAGCMPNDGILDLYIVKKIPNYHWFYLLLQYLVFHYKSHPEFLIHETGRRIHISSREMQFCRIDGEVYYENGIDYQIMPQAIDFVCPVPNNKSIGRGRNEGNGGPAI